MHTIKSKWDFFEGMCLRKVSDQQIREAKIAFYAGASSLLALQIEIMNSEIAPTDAVKTIKMWERECTEFGSHIIAAAAIKQAKK